MTGFGKAETELPNKKITIEIKSLNSKQLDIALRIPNIYKEKEMEIRNMIFHSIERGKVDFLIYVDYADKSISTHINPEAVENYYKQICDISKSRNINMPTDCFSAILRLPETIKSEISELDDTEWNEISKTIQKAMDMLVEFRNQEGVVLERIFETKINNIASLLRDIEPYEAERVEKIKSKLTENLNKLDVNNFDENRLAQEMIFYIERLDINEEKSRLGNHLNYFLETLNKEKKQGRKLGFIAQEIGREINTLGSKSNHAEMQKIVVRMKDELEQIKEQILNVL